MKVKVFFPYFDHMKRSKYNVNSMCEGLLPRNDSFQKRKIFYFNDNSPGKQ